MRSFEDKLNDAGIGMVLSMVAVVTMLGLGTLFYFAVRQSTYSPQTVVVDRTGQLCHAASYSHRHVKIRDKDSDCEVLSKKMENDPVSYSEYSLENRTYVFFRYFSEVDGKYHSGHLRIDSAEADSVYKKDSSMTIRVSIINPAHYMF